MVSQLRVRVRENKSNAIRVREKNKSSAIRGRDKNKSSVIRGRDKNKSSAIRGRDMNKSSALRVRVKKISSGIAIRSQNTRAVMRETSTIVGLSEKRDFKRNVIKERFENKSNAIRYGFKNKCISQKKRDQSDLFSFEMKIYCLQKREPALSPQYGRARYRWF